MDWEKHLDKAFLPERWLEMKGRPRHMYTFGSGKHQCLGMQLYMMEVKMLVAEMTRRCEGSNYTPILHHPECRVYHPDYPFPVMWCDLQSETQREHVCVRALFDDKGSSCKP